MAVGRRAVAGSDPLLEDAELRGAVDGGGAHAGFHAGPPLLRCDVAGVDDLHWCVPSVGWAKAPLRRAHHLAPSRAARWWARRFAPLPTPRPRLYNTLHMETNGNDG